VGGAPQDRSAQGALDLAGNVSEWVMDRFRPRYPDCAAPCADPVVLDEAQAGEASELRVVRGGAWYRAAEACRAAGRSRMRSGQVAGDVGFRCAAPKAR
jgi:formylglycine-generating enzyme required for sulfatase activity